MEDQTSAAGQMPTPQVEDPSKSETGTVATQPVQSVQVARQASTQNSNMKLIVACIVVLLILVVGIVIWYRTNQSGSSYRETKTSATKQQVSEKSLESQINAIDIEDLDKDFADVNRDLESL